MGWPTLVQGPRRVSISAAFTRTSSNWKITETPGKGSFWPVSDRRVGALGPKRATAEASVAVLPFVNMGGDPEQDYFADGITEDIITELSRWRSLLVMSRNATFRFKGRSVDMQRVGRELGVRFLVDGSIRRMGERVRVTAQLNVKELERAAFNNPFPRAESQPRTLHLFFLSEEPLCADLASLNGLRSGKEAFALRDKVFYLHTPDGFAVSKLAKNAERHIHVDATARNWNTVTKLLEMAKVDD